MSYQGGKGGAGVHQQIINCMPPHTFYAELFTGHGYIFKIKRPARYNLAIDLDRNALNKITPLGTAVENWGWPNGPFFETRCQCAIEFLEKNLNKNIIEYDKVLLYLDPPYLPSTLSRAKGSMRNGQRYKYKFGTDAHEKLLSIITQLKCYVMISGYQSAMYDRTLTEAAGWYRKDFDAMTRGGLKTESLWMNYDWHKLTELHDYRFIGETFREREVWKKRKSTIERKFNKLGTLEKRAMLEHLQKLI